MLGPASIIIGIGTFFTIITNVTRLLVQRGQDRVRKQRQNMLSGVFFTEVGNELPRLFAQWIYSLQHLKHSYPYLFSLVLRTNPFSESPSAIVK